eukprot:755029-Hanusia_phi.AAC.10
MSVDHKPDRPSERERIEQVSGAGSPVLVLKVVQAGGTVVYFGCARVNGILATSRGIGDRQTQRCGHPPLTREWQRAQKLGHRRA